LVLQFVNIVLDPLSSSLQFQSDIHVFKHNLNYHLSSICVTGRYNIECSNYNGGDRRKIDKTTGRPYGVVTQDGVVYYTSVTPNK